LNDTRLNPRFLSRSTARIAVDGEGPSYDEILMDPTAILKLDAQAGAVRDSRGRPDRVKEGSSSFLKKRTKKL